MQVNFQRPPIAAEQRLDDAVDAAERHVDRLHLRGRLPAAQMQRDGYGLLVVGDVQLHAVVMDRDEA